MEWRSIATQGGTALKPLAIVSLHASPLAALGAGENGGMNVYVRAVCEELSRRGIPTEVFTRRSGPDGPQRVRLHQNSWVTQVEAGEPRPVDKGRLLDLLPAFTDGVLRQARHAPDGYSLIHSHYWLSGWTAARLAAEWDLPWVHTAHTLARVKNERAASGAGLEPDHRLAGEQAVVRGAHRPAASTAPGAGEPERHAGEQRPGRRESQARGPGAGPLDRRSGALHRRRGPADPGRLAGPGRGLRRPVLFRVLRPGGPGSAGLRDAGGRRPCRRTGHRGQGRADRVHAGDARPGPVRGADRPPPPGRGAPPLLQPP